MGDSTNFCREHVQEWLDFPRNICTKLPANGMHFILSPESVEPETLLIFAAQCPIMSLPGLPTSTRIDIGCHLGSNPQSCRHWPIWNPYFDHLGMSHIAQAPGSTFRAQSIFLILRPQETLIWEWIRSFWDSVIAGVINAVNPITNSPCKDDSYDSLTFTTTGLGPQNLSQASQVSQDLFANPGLWCCSNLPLPPPERELGQQLRLGVAIPRRKPSVNLVPGKLREIGRMQRSQTSLKLWRRQAQKSQ